MAATAARRICVTGATGKAGLATVRHLREHGYEVVATDVALSGDDVAAGVLKADLTDYGQATEVLRGTDAVVHLANIPAPGRSTPAVTFNANITMNFNVFHAAAALGLAKVVWASSETTLGLPFGHGPEQVPGAPGELRYAPVDEDHFPFPSTTYALSKVASETIAEQISRWSDIPFVGLRISNIMEPHDYERFPSLLAGPALPQVEPVGLRRRPRRRRRLPPRPGSRRHGQPERHHRRRRHGHEPPVPRPPRRGLPRHPAHPEIAEFGTLLSIDRAKQVIGYEPRHSWRDEIQVR